MIWDLELGFGCRFENISMDSSFEIFRSVHNGNRDEERKKIFLPCTQPVPHCLSPSPPAPTTRGIAQPRVELG